MREQAEAQRDPILQLRRRIHRHPELGYSETDTGDAIRAALHDIGLDPRPVARTGLVTEIHKGAGPTVLIRADMDALPIQELTGLPFASERPGLMHACGHDTHCAMAFGAAAVLRETSFSGTIRLLFQPAEEGNYDDPDGWSGGRRVVEEGALEGVAAAVGLHQIPTMPTGSIVIRNGPVMAAADFFRIEIEGQSAHAGMAPEKGIDTIVIASQLVSQLQTIVARNVPPMDTGVVSVGAIEGGTAPNIIADRVVMRGTVRALTPATHEMIHARIRALCAGLEVAHPGAKLSYHLKHGVPPTVNDPEIAEVARAAARKVFAPGQVSIGEPIMAGEDFSYIARAVPSVFALLGTRVTQGEVHPLHTPKMTVNEDALPLGAAWLAQTAVDLLAAAA